MNASVTMDLRWHITFAQNICLAEAEDHQDKQQCSDKLEPSIS
ncbi:MAG: hypothetical protein OXF60_00010 [Gammaproteobacteria bacterium]|nr:hypothetical protein [Gammaproteobacteria bacterium]MCY4218239.1 hypothetical protein [Gammaproteobacteria bacterium]